MAKYTFNPHITDSRCVECLFRAQSLRDKVDYLKHQGCDVDINFGKMAFAQWIVYMPGHNPNTMCDWCARSYAANALEENHEVVAHGVTLATMDDWPGFPVLANYLRPGDYESRQRGCTCPTGHADDPHRDMCEQAFKHSLMLVARNCPIHGQDRVTAQEQIVLVKMHEAAQKELAL